LRFLNLKLSTPDNNDLKIDFREGLNIISIPDKELLNIIKQVPFFGMYGTDHERIDSALKNISCTLTALSAESDGEIIFINSDGEFLIKESDPSGGCSANEDDEKSNRGNKLNICTVDDFAASSFYSPEQIQKNSDPVFDTEKIKSLLINNEIFRLKFPFFQIRETLIKEKEKELTDMNRDRQLLELKKMKKEKLLKEINLLDRNVNKIEKRRESILKYKTTLNEIITTIETRDKQSSKINNLKKDLIELREIKEKITSVENTLRERFSHFSEQGNEQLPDLEQIQESFNSFRDINELIDKFSLNKKRYSVWALKIIASMIIFSLTAFIFMIFTSSASFILGLTSALAAGAAGLSGLIYHFKIMKFYPADLFEKKKQMENSLIDLLKKNHFSVDGCKTGELYEILFQYFEDFINYRDISYELTELKKKISNSSSLIEKENKMKQLTDEIEDINRIINNHIDDLDLSIHPRPEHDGITRTIHDIDELLEENGVEINEKKSLIVKFEEEIEEYDKTETSSLSAELKLEEVLTRISECKEKITHIKFLNTIFNDSADIWSTEKLTELSELTMKKFSLLTDGSFIQEDIAETVNNLIVHAGKIKSEHKGLKKYLSFSIKAALSELLFIEDLPPVFIIDPFTPDNEFADNMKKLLPEFFSGRQVVLIIPGNEPDIKGNLITL